MKLPTNSGTSDDIPSPQTSLPAVLMPDALQVDAAQADDAAVAVWTLHPGDRIEVHAPGQHPYQAVIEDTMTRLHVAWVRELRIGQRRMLSTQDHRFYRC